MLVLLAACQTTPITSTNDACLIWAPVKYHAKTTDADTIARIRDLNAKRDAYCKGSTP